MILNHVAVSQNLEIALDYSRRGWAVFPVHAPTLDGRCDCGNLNCTSPAKHPWTVNGFRDATKDPEKIKDFWAGYPDANLGIATGASSGIIVMDVDGSEGAALAQRNGIPITITATTAKGVHYYFKHPGYPIKSAVGIFPQLDSRGDGGYVVAPGSKHISGTIYSWKPGLSPDDVSLAGAPDWWLDALLKKDTRTTQTQPSTGSIVEGTRNSTLASFAGTMRAAGFNQEAILSALRAENASRCNPPLCDSEVRSIASSISRYAPSQNSSFFQGKTFVPNLLAEHLKASYHFISTPIDEAGKGVRLLVYKDGVFQLGESVTRSCIHELLGPASTPQRIDTVVELLKESSKKIEGELNPKAGKFINVENGILEWETGKLLPHSPDFFSTIRIHANYNPNASSAVIDRFLEEIFPSDALGLVEEMLGYLLIPETKYQMAFMLLGSGANGKSTFLSLCLRVLGEENVSRISLQDLTTNRFTSAELVGKVANIYPDLPAQALENSDVFKAIVSGDSIKAERKFGQPFILKPFARLLFSANELPKSKDLTDAFFRRWVIIPFPNKFEGAQADRDLISRLTTPEALSHLLNRALAGLMRLEAQRGFSISQSVNMASMEYRRTCDSTLEFIQENIETGTTGVLPKNQVYDSYKKYCLELGSVPVSQKVFNKRLLEVTKSGESRQFYAGRKLRVWTGLAWKEGAEPADFGATLTEGEVIL